MTAAGKSSSSGTARQVAAIVALVALAAAVAYLVGQAARRWDILLVSVISLGIAVVGGWYALSRRGTVRVVALVIAGCGVLATVVVILGSESLGVLVVAGLLGACSAAAAGTRSRRPGTGRRRPV